MILAFTITITCVSWMIPAAVTLLIVAAVALVMFLERHETGLLAGLGGAIAFIAGIIGILITWLTWFLTMFLSR